MISLADSVGADVEYQHEAVFYGEQFLCAYECEDRYAHTGYTHFAPAEPTKI